MLKVRIAHKTDYDKIWKIIQKVISSGDTYVFDPGSDKDKMLSYWCSPSVNCYVVERDGQIVGTFLIKANQPDLGSHIANAAFMTAPGETGRGIGSFMVTYALDEARRLDYKAMQFNFVVKSNENAVRLWLKLGFTIIGEIPEAFNHRQKGLTNALIMYKRL